LNDTIEGLLSVAVYQEQLKRDLQGSAAAVKSIQMWLQDWIGKWQFFVCHYESDKGYCRWTSRIKTSDRNLKWF